MLFAELVAIFDPGFFKKEDKEKKERESHTISGSPPVQLRSIHFPEAQDYKSAYTPRFSVPNFQFTLLLFLCTEPAVIH